MSLVPGMESATELVEDAETYILEYFAREQEYRAAGEKAVEALDAALKVLKSNRTKLVADLRRDDENFEGAKYVSPEARKRVEDFLSVPILPDNEGAEQTSHVESP